MKNKKMTHLLAAAALAALPLTGLVGCDKSEPTPDTPKAVDNAMDKAKNSGDDVKDKVDDIKENTKDSAANAADTASDMAADAKNKVGGMTDVMSKNMTDMLNQVQSSIDDKQYSTADATLKKVEGMSDKMPAAMKTKVAELRSKLDAAMKASKDADNMGAGK